MADEILLAFAILVFFVAACRAVVVNHRGFSALLGAIAFIAAIGAITLIGKMDERGVPTGCCCANDDPRTFIVSAHD